MAQRVSPTAAETDELDVLVAARQVPIGDEYVTVRELGFFECLNLQAPIAALVDALALASAEGQIDLCALHAVCAQHPQATFALLAQACDRPIAWVERLRGSEGDRLLMTFWAANADFFLQRVLAVLELRRHAPAAAGATSSPP